VCDLTRYDICPEILGGFDDVVTLAATIAAASAAYAASETVTMNAIDANGVGKEIGTLLVSDTQAGLQVTPALVGPAAGRPRIPCPR
jgi:Cu/Zn superoxide dismutase